MLLNFIQERLKSVFAQVDILLVVCERLEVVKPTKMILLEIIFNAFCWWTVFQEQFIIIIIIKEIDIQYQWT